MHECLFYFQSKVFNSIHILFIYNLAGIHLRFIFLKPGNLLEAATVEAPVSGHHREAERVSTTGAGQLQEYINLYRVCHELHVEFKQGFVKAAINRAVRLRVCSESFDCISAGLMYHYYRHKEDR